MADQPFPANNAVQFHTVDVLLNGSVQNISNLFDSGANGGVFNLFDVPGLSFPGENRLPIGMVATIVDPQAGHLPMGPVSAPIYLTFDGGAANQPPTFTSPGAYSIRRTRPGSPRWRRAIRRTTP